MKKKQKKNSQNEEVEERNDAGCVDEEREEEGLFTLRLCSDLAYTHIHSQCRKQILITPY